MSICVNLMFVLQNLQKSKRQRGTKIVVIRHLLHSDWSISQFWVRTRCLYCFRLVTSVSPRTGTSPPCDNIGGAFSLSKNPVLHPQLVADPNSMHGDDNSRLLPVSCVIWVANVCGVAEVLVRFFCISGLAQFDLNFLPVWRSLPRSGDRGVVELAVNNFLSMTIALVGCCNLSDHVRVKKSQVGMFAGLIDDVESRPGKRDLNLGLWGIYLVIAYYYICAH
jgi:hypothetical protein